MDLTNESYVIRVTAPTFSERYYRVRDGWRKVSARGRTFRLTAEQVLNHLLPALAGLRPEITVDVDHRSGRRPRRPPRGGPRARRRAPTRL